ncbi:MAG: SDR family oxidoreductase [Steroidobacteraceae bacterium]
MQGKTVVMTGATSGIGAVVAETLARQGARIVFTARDQARGEATLTQLRAIAPNVNHCVHYTDLSKMVQMKRVAAEIATAEPRIDVLINNAGLIAGQRVVTEDGLELTFATNHMAYFVLTSLLRPRLGPGARIVSTASQAHTGATLDFDDLQCARGFSSMKAYSRSKLCNVLFTRELARRLVGSGITANAAHPGFVATRFGSQMGGIMAVVIRGLMKTFALKPQQGAETLIYLASSPDVADTTGAYFTKCRKIAPSPAAQDDASAKRLWDVSAKLSGVDL